MWCNFFPRPWTGAWSADRGEGFGPWPQQFSARCSGQAGKRAAASGREEPHVDIPHFSILSYRNVNLVTGGKDAVVLLSAMSPPVPRIVPRLGGFLFSGGRKKAGAPSGPDRRHLGKRKRWGARPHQRWPIKKGDQIRDEPKQWELSIEISGPPRLGASGFSSRKPDSCRSSRKRSCAAR